MKTPDTSKQTSRLLRAIDHPARLHLARREPEQLAV